MSLSSLEELLKPLQIGFFRGFIRSGSAIDKNSVLV